MIIKDKKILFQLNIEKQLLFADITRSKIRIKTELWKAREGVIIECPLNWQYHDRRDVRITSRMAVSKNLITVTVIWNIENSSF